MVAIPATKETNMKAVKLTREQWLTMALHKHVGPLLMEKAGAVLPADCKVSIGFPGGGSARKRIGECWPRVRSSLGVNEIFLNPAMRDVRRLMDVLVHEAIHAADDCKSGHKGFFRKTAKAVGLTGKMTSTCAGPELSTWIDDVLAKMPAFDYGSLDIDGRKKQSTRMIKVICLDCGYSLRTTQKWIEVGVPTCCCGGNMGVC
jgi:hypothetical protein